MGQDHRSCRRGDHRQSKGMGWKECTVHAQDHNFSYESVDTTKIAMFDLALVWFTLN